MSELALSQWEDRVYCAFRALQRGIMIESLEEDRVIDSLVKIMCGFATEKKMLVWSAVSTRKTVIKQTSEGVTYRLETLPHTPLDVLLKETLDSSESGFMVFCDPSFLGDAADVRLFREALERIRTEGKPQSIVLIGREIKLPAELAQDFWCTEYQLPTRGDFLRVFNAIAARYKDSSEHTTVKFNTKALSGMAEACAGLTERQARQLLSNAVVLYGGIDERAIQLAHAEKAQAVKRSGIMEIQTPKGGLEIVGGLTKLKKYISEIDQLISDREAAKQFGCRLPSGILFMGLSGCGKSLVAEALAGHWKLPLLRLEMGRIFGSLIGQSEAQLREVFKLAQAVAPCLVFIDEFEKGIGGGGELDGNTTGRIKQSLLSWLQEKPEEIIVVATVNSIAPFEKNPEMLRAGRFDEIFFVDLPDQASRVEILKIHLEKANKQVMLPHLAQVASKAAGYSGAELAQVVEITLRRAFQGKTKINVESLLQALKEKIPLSVTMKEQLDALRGYCKTGRARPAGELLEDDLLTPKNTLGLVK